MNGLQGIGGRRLTTKQKARLREYLELALASVPDDRSCFTCDYYRDSFCLSWQLDVPREARETGCQNWKDEGAPF